MRPFIAQLNPTIGDFSGNLNKVLDAIQKARTAGADLVLFPELMLTGYPPQDFLLLPSFIEQAEISLQQVIQASQGIAVIVGLPRHNPDGGEKGLYNSAAIIVNGALQGFQDKFLLPTYDVFDEQRYFDPGVSTQTWAIAGKKVAVTICEDIWQHSEMLRYTSYKRDPIDELIKLKPDLVVNLSASPYNVGKHFYRIQVCAKAAKTLKCPLLLCNQVGGNDSLLFDGYSLYIGADGKLLMQLKGFEEDMRLIDTNATEPVSAVNDTEDLYKALVMGIRDYFKKLGFTKACLGLSGGVDSALVACLAADALGPGSVLAVLMPSRFSSESSLTDAKELAENLGLSMEEISIEAPFKTYLETLKPVFQGKPHDVTEENLQARIRGMLLMALSNKFGYLVLSTGNKSELAMGYSTLYGDLCGGLAVISDVTKGQVYALCEWINRKGRIIPESTLTKPPSAELRPNQKDSDSLPDYAIVDAVLQDYLEEHLTAEKISEKHGYSLELVKSLIKRIHQNEYKRRQAPPGLRVSEKAFSVGRHYPIVQRLI